MGVDDVGPRTGGADVAERTPDDDNARETWQKGACEEENKKRYSNHYCEANRLYYGRLLI